MSKLLINDYPLMVSPKLAVRIGLYEAHFLQQIHWLCEKSKNIRDGKAWVYNTYEQWLEHFPFMEKQQIGRIVRKLERLGVLITTGEYNKHKLDNTKWYRVNYASPVLDFSDGPDEDSNSYDRDSNMNVEDSHMNPVDSNMNAEASNLNPQLPETFNTDLTIDFLQIGDGVSPAAADPEFRLAETSTTAKPKPKSQANPDNVRTWQAYARAYRERYGVLPEANAQTRGMAAKLVKLVGAEKAPALVQFYVWHNDAYFVRNRHTFGGVLQSYQRLLTDMACGEQMTAARARQAEGSQSNFDTMKRVLAERRAKRGQQGEA